MQSNELSHLDNKTLQPKMVNVSHKVVSEREAKAQAIVSIPLSVYEVLKEQNGNSKKGPVFTTAILAGTMAVKNTPQLIPLCHALTIEGCAIDIFSEGKTRIVVNCSVKVTAKTGVEMEALVGASVAALTIYDMCKAISHEIVIEKVHLLKKTGGKNDF